MRGLDDTDREILTLLLEDARRPYSEIAEAVDLSPPAVSDRVERLQEIGLIRRFTVDVDRSLLREGVPLLVTVDTAPGAAKDVRDTLGEADAVEYVFRTVDNQVVCTATAEESDIGNLLAAVDEGSVRSYDVRLLADREWTPRLGPAELAPECDECGNTVTSEGETARLDGDVYHFCCESCLDNFVGRYERFQEEA
jgi:Lrp/AsnC family leucine-responsive transcriptional regulator